jgi:hypothetical protein
MSNLFLSTPGGLVPVGSNQVLALDNLVDVDAASPVDGAVLTWDADAGLWVAAKNEIYTAYKEDTSTEITGAASGDGLATYITGLYWLWPAVPYDTLVLITYNICFAWPAGGPGNSNVQMYGSVRIGGAGTWDYFDPRPIYGPASTNGQSGQTVWTRSFPVPANTVIDMRPYAYKNTGSVVNALASASSMVTTQVPA